MKRLTKSYDRKLCGVCGEIAEYLNIDPTIVRLIWLLLVLCAGTGMLAYIIAAIIMPEGQEKMISFIICLLILTILFGLAFKLTGALLKACFWLFISLPIGLVLGGLGIVCCCTIILIPVGIGLFKAGIHVIIPGQRILLRPCNCVSS